jgi:hypothetical protein
MCAVYPTRAVYLRSAVPGEKTRLGRFSFSVGATDPYNEDMSNANTTTKSRKRVFYGPSNVRPAYVVRIRGEHGCMCTGNPDMIPGQVECYLSSRPAGACDVYYYEQCAACGGSGRTCTNRRRMSWAPCKVCGGEAETPETLIASYYGPEYAGE